MPGETNTDRIARLERENATLIERVDGIKSDIQRLRKDLDDLPTPDIARLRKDLDDLLKSDKERLTKDLEDLRSKRWDVRKIILAAALGSLLTLAVSYLNRTIERRTEVESAVRPPATYERK